MWRFVRCAIVPLELAAAAALALGQACGPLPAFQLPAGAPALTPQEETWLFQAMDAQTLGALNGVSDPGLDAEPNKVLARLATAFPPLGFPLRVRVVIGDEANAFAMPGGQIFITRPLVAFLHSEDELAGILAHELGHEYTRQISLTYAAKMARITGSAAAGNEGEFLRRYNQVLTWEEESKPDKRQPDTGQDAADRAGLEILQRAGYDPKALPRAFARLAAVSPESNWFSDLLGLTPSHVRRLQAMLAEQPAANCPAAPQPSAAAFRRWQAAVIAYNRPLALPRLPGLLSQEHLAPLRDAFRSLHFSPDGRRLLAMSGDGVWVLSVNPLRPLLHVAEPSIAQALFSPDASSLVFATLDGRVERWDIATGSRTLLRQVTPPLPACDFGFTTPDAAYFGCERERKSFSLYSVATGARAFRIDSSGGDLDFSLSPDGRYLAVNQLTHGEVLDLRTLDLLKLGGKMRSFLNASFVFVSGSEALASNDLRRIEWQDVAFPSGRTLRKFKLDSGGASIDPETSGPFVISRPANFMPAGALNPLTHRVIFLSHTADVDGYGSLWAGEDTQGRVVLLRDSGTKGAKLTQVAAVTLPFARLRAKAIGAASPDLRLLAISSGRRSAVWDLRGGRRLGFLDGFHDAWFHGANLDVLGDAPARIYVPGALIQSQLRQTDYDLRHGTRQQFPRVAQGDLLRGFGPVTELLHFGNSAGKSGYRFLDTPSGKLLWSMPLRVRGDNAALPELLPNAEAVLVLAWPKGDDARGTASANAALKVALSAAKPGRSRWIEIRDARSGALLHAWLLGDEAPIAAGTSAYFGGHLCLGGGDGRTRCFDAATGTPQRIWFGVVGPVAPAADEVALATGRRSVAVYHGVSAQPLVRYTFPDDVIFGQFGAGGRRLLVVTRAENAYVLAVPAAGGVQ